MIGCHQLRAGIAEITKVTPDPNLRRPVLISTRVDDAITAYGPVRWQSHPYDSEVFVTRGRN